MKALFIANGININEGKPGISGGDIRWIEIARRWQEMGLEIHVLTQNAGRELCKKLGKVHMFSIGRNKHLINTHKKLGWTVDDSPSHELIKNI